ncbi:hypothetical protein [Stenotrophobium rhamnosiphilum]|uniref:Uncharacterized protein n=1 Tax=Stenotrophobium rhamnosiphilum TaxID=2029166 RepID=A0A2T5MKM8_9GAMM|nr:hypothetical protein [Stenotrophobium rhamnosiphilum]PTU33125.1 hypothetical protein CJD38_03195 [Stenotrophobium rhamnosiphilum]
MSFLQAAGLAIRLFSLWVFLYSLQALAVGFALRNTMAFPLTTPEGLLAFAPTFISFGLAIFLWRFPLAIARILVPRTSEAATAITLNEAWQLGSVMVGLLAISSAGPELLKAFGFVFFATQDDYGTLPTEHKIGLFAALAKTAFGLFLVFGSKQIYRRFSHAP